MLRICPITGKKTIIGNNRSRALNATKRRFTPNLHRHRFWNENKGCFVRLRISAKAIRTIDKNGLESVLNKLYAKNKKM